MSKRHRPSGLTFNVTPMVDIVFLLIIFFMLVSQFASQEIRPMDLPNPYRSKFDERIKPDNRAVIQMLFADHQNDSSEIFYFVGSARFNSVEDLTPYLESRVARDPGFRAVVRADRRIEYDDVRELLAGIARAKVPEMFLTAHVDGSRAEPE